MKTTFATLLLAFAATAAMAETPQSFKDDFTSTRSRAEVISEVLNARADGSLDVIGEIGALSAPTILLGKTRDSVRAEIQGLAKTRNAQRASFSGSYLPG